MNSPLAWVAIFLALGILAGVLIKISSLFIILIALLLVLIALLAVKHKIISFISLSFTFFFIGCLIFQIKQIYPPNHIMNFTPSEPELAHIEGIIVDEPQLGRTSYGERKVNFILKA
ncbi:MAG: hypothetical protein ABH847_01480, partial [Candidatus Omnitrophota bacterium]